MASDCSSWTNCNLWLREMYLVDQKEPWTRGNPEIVVQVIDWDKWKNGEPGAVLGCICDDQEECTIVDRTFTDIQPVENQVWHAESLPDGELLEGKIAPAAVVPLAGNKTEALWVYENDHEPRCAFQPEHAGDRFSQQLAYTMEEGNRYVLGAVALGNVLYLGMGLGIYGYAVAEESYDDDGIGIVQLPHYASGWSEPRQIGFYDQNLVNQEDGSWARFQLIDPIPPLSVSMSGPTVGQPYEWVTVAATVVSDYVAPLSYSWTVNGVPGCGNQSTCGASLGGEGTATQFDVTVTDAAQSVGYGHRSVYVECTAPPCAEAPALPSAGVGQDAGGGPVMGTTTSDTTRASRQLRQP
jgi:hypothetical protein